MRDRITARRSCACRESACAIARRMRTQATRAQIGLPADRRIYLCPQSLVQDPSRQRCAVHRAGRARPRRRSSCFSRDRRPVRRWPSPRASNAACGVRSVPPRQQFKFLPRMSRGDFLSVMKISDVMIDTLRWSGGNTTLDALASALPVVTLEGRFMRGRQTAAMLRILGIEELIAGDQEQYVALALRVASDKAYRAELSARIRGGLPKLFDREGADRGARSTPSRRSSGQ